MSDFTINTSLYQSDINDMVYELGADAQKLLREEMRLLLRDIINLTPPKTFAQGRNAIAKDLAKVYITTRKVAKELAAKSPGAAKAFVRALQRGDTSTAAQIASGGSGATITVRVRAYSRAGERSGSVKGYTQNRRLPGGYIAGVSSNTPIVKMLDPSVHIRRRTKYGRVGGNFISQMVENTNNYVVYLKTLLDRVGFASAGWAKAYMKLGGTDLPDYVSKLAYAPRSSFAEVLNSDEKSIIVSTSSSKIPGYNRIVLEAMRNRERSMASEINRLRLGGRTQRGSFSGTPLGAPL